MADFELARESIEEMLDYDVLITKFENQAEQRRQRSANALLGFKITTPPMTYTTLQTYRNFFISKKGALTSFTFLSPFDNTTYTVRFESGSWKTQHKSGLFQATFDLMRVTS